MTKLRRHRNAPTEREQQLEGAASDVRPGFLIREGLQSVRTHDLEILLRFTGVEWRVKAKHLAEWSVVLDWNPDKRYRVIGQSTPQQAADMITSVKRLLEVL